MCRTNCRNIEGHAVRNCYTLNTFVILTLSVLSENSQSTVLPAKSDSDVMFCLQSYKGLRIDRSLVYKSYLQDRINTQDLSIRVSSSGAYKLMFYLTIVNKI